MSSIRSSPASGPFRIAMATAWFKATRATVGVGASIVQFDDLIPVRGRGVRRIRMDRRDRGLDGVRTDRRKARARSRCDLPSRSCARSHNERSWSSSKMTSPVGDVRATRRDS